VFLDLPIHPLVVHLPMALTVLLPLGVLAAWLLAWRGVPAHRSWWLPLVLLALLVGSGKVAEESGEDQAERVETIVPESAFEAHEDAAEQFLLLGTVVLILALPGAVAFRGAHWFRVAGSVATLAVLAAGWEVGHSGGLLVYRYHAGSAYGVGAVGGSSPGTVAPERSREDEEAR
jgi:hypothetical protein